MLVLSTAACVLALACLVFGTHSIARGKPRRCWTALYGAVGLGFAARTAYLATPPSMVSLAIEECGLAVMLAGAIVVISAPFSLLHSRPRWGRALVAISARVAIFVALVAGGYLLYVQPRVHHEGVWSGIPTFILVQRVPNLPGAALNWRPHDRNSWSLAARIERGEVSDADLDRVRIGMTERLRRDPGNENWKIAQDLVRWNQGLDDLGAIYFQHKLRAFLDTADTYEREISGGELWPFLPTTGKSSFSNIGVPAGAAIASPQVPRIIELTHDPNDRVRAVAVDLFTLCGDAAAPAVPRIFELGRTESDWPNFRWSAVSVLGYLSHTSVVIRDNLIARSRASDRFEAALAVDALSQ